MGMSTIKALKWSKDELRVREAAKQVVMELEYAQDKRSKGRWEFRAFHSDNPEVYEEFKKQAFSLINAGYSFFGARAIWETMRWFFKPENGKFKYRDGQKSFKLQNNYCPFYAEMFIKDHPEHKGFFNLRNI